MKEQNEIRKKGHYEKDQNKARKNATKPERARRDEKEWDNTRKSDTIVR